MKQIKEMREEKSPSRQDLDLNPWKQESDNVKEKHAAAAAAD